MKLSDAHIKDGDLLAFKGTGFWSRLIQCVTKARVTHVGLAVTIRERQCIIEAREMRGVRVFPLREYLRANSRVYWYELDDESSVSRKALVDYCFNVWGARYARAWQFLRSWGLVSKAWANRMRLPEDVDDNRFFCSELVLAALQAAGYTGDGYETEAAKASPGDIVELTCFRPRGRLEL